MKIKNYKISIFIIFLFLCVISFSSCELQQKATPDQPIEKEFPFDQSKEVYEIINCTLKQLVPRSVELLSHYLLGSICQEFLSQSRRRGLIPNCL